MKGMKKDTAKYNVLQYVRGSGGLMSPVNTKLLVVGQRAQAWTPDENYAWETYQVLSPADKQTVQEFCGQNPQKTALIPKDAPIHAVGCAAWISASNKAER